MLLLSIQAQGEGRVNGDAAGSGLTKNSNLKEERDNISSGGSVNGGNTHENAVGVANQPTSTPSNPESNDEIIKRVRAGWTANNANAVTIGELYLMVNEKLKLVPLFCIFYSVEYPFVFTITYFIFLNHHQQFGSNSKVKMEYWWEEVQGCTSEEVLSATPPKLDAQQEFSKSPLAETTSELTSSVSPNLLSKTLQKLLSISKMYSSQTKVSQL